MSTVAKADANHHCMYVCMCMYTQSTLISLIRAAVQKATVIKPDLGSVNNKPIDPEKQKKSAKAAEKVCMTVSQIQYMHTIISSNTSSCTTLDK